MKQKDLTHQVKECAVLFYRNQEQEAYDRLNSMLGEINQIFQRLAADALADAGEEEQGLRQYRLQLMEELVTAYQRKDNLALADLLYYNISEMTAEQDEIRGEL